MTSLKIDMDHPPSFEFAAVVPSNLFTFSAHMKPVSAGEQPNSTGAVKTSEAPTISFRSAFNAAAPANHLPAELVVAILTSGAWSHWWELVTLTHICQHWRTVALGTPQLWADAAHSAFTGECGWRCDEIECLPTFLARSMPCPLRADLRSPVNLAAPEDSEDGLEAVVLHPHLLRLTHLSILDLNVTDFVEVVHMVGPHIRNLESLYMPQVIPDFAGIPLFININTLPVWRDADLPHLHTLAISAHCFVRPIAVTSLKTLILYGNPRSHDQFLAALDRCALGLESLTLRSWSRPERASRARNATARTVHLPNLRRFRVSLSSEGFSTEPLTFLFTSLSFPPGVAIHLDWKCNPGNTRELLPKDLIGLQAPPFFDSMCLHLFALPHTATLHCYVDDAERLCVLERPMVDPRRPRGRSFSEFLDEHRYPTVTQLAVDFDMDPRYGSTLFGQGNRLRMFVGGLPNLRRLDVLGKTIGDTKLQVVKEFLSLPRLDDSPAAPVVAGKTLGYVCEVAEHLKNVNKVEYVDNIRAELGQLERLLKAHLAAGDPRLHRLEVCIMYSYPSPESHPSRRVYPYVHNVTPSTGLTACVASTYLRRFGALVDEVVFVGHVEKRSPGYRVLTGAERQPVPGPKRLNRGERGTTASRSARKGR